MMTEPEPTEVTPTSRPPTAPTSSVGSGRIVGSPCRPGCRAALAHADVEPQGVGRGGEEQREAERDLERLLDVSASPPRRQLTGKGPMKAIGTEPTISHLAISKLGAPCLRCTIAPPVL